MLTQKKETVHTSCKLKVPAAWTPQPMSLRVTHILRNEDGEWRPVHRHADFAPMDHSAG
jgi:ketosteroid isomerase-like protein